MLDKGSGIVSMELRNIIDKEELVKDAMKLQKYQDNDRMIRLIDKIKDELADTTDNMGELSMIYKFAERLKKEIE